MTVVAYLTEEGKPLLVFCWTAAAGRVLEIQVEPIKFPLSKERHNFVGEIFAVGLRFQHSRHLCYAEAARIVLQ